MTFIDVITALVILTFFFFGLSMSFHPAYTAWNNAMTEYRTAQTIHFIAESFKNECERTDRNIERWERTVAAAKELEEYVITELKEGEIVRALRAVCIISGERVEIIGLCTP